MDDGRPTKVNFNFISHKENKNNLLKERGKDLQEKLVKANII